MSAPRRSDRGLAGVERDPLGVASLRYGSDLRYRPGVMGVTMRRLEMKIAALLARRAAKRVALEARAKPLDSGIGAEAPIRTAADDRLRRTDFAGRLANVLSELNLDEGRVFAIRGGWGFGKSSLKNLITERLDEMDGGADWLDFNPWRWGDADAIAKALFGQLANRLGGEHSKKALARAEALRRYGAMLTGATGQLKKTETSTHWISLALTNVSLIAIASAVGFQLPTVAKIAGALAVFAVGLSLLGRALTHWGRDRSNESLEKLRDALEKRLKELDRPLVVFVDDIDRLEPEQIRMLLRQVKANANLPNIVFVLLFQPSIVERALDPVADGDGRAFLEKIVQANFDLPAVPRSIVHDTFAKDLQAVAGVYATEANGFEQTRWGNMFIGTMQPRLRNMRDAKRLISSISVHLPLHATGHTFEVNLIDFFGVEAIRVFEPDLYDALFRERDLVLQSHRFRGDRREEQDRRAVEQLMETVPEETRDLSRDALKELFPTLQWAFGGTTYGNDWQKSWLAQKRICTSRFFPRYFELQTSIGELSESGFVHFLEATGDAGRLASAIEDIEANGLLFSLISRMSESIDRLPVANAEILMPAIFRIAQKVLSARGRGMDSPFTSSWLTASWYLKALPVEARGLAVLTALRTTGSLSIASTLIHLSDPADRKEGDEFDPSLDVPTVEAMKVEWLYQVRVLAAEPDRLMAETDLVSILYRWRDYGGGMDEPRIWLDRAIETDERFVAVVEDMMSRGTSHSWGDRVSRPHLTFNRSTVEDFIGIERAKARLDAIDPENHPAHEEALRTLGSHLDLWLGLREPGLDDL